MKKLYQFIKDLIDNSGFLIFLSILISRSTSFVSTIIIIRMLTKDNYGWIALCASIFAVFVPLSGLGSYQGLLHFGILKKSDSEKKSLSAYAFQRGFLMQLIVIATYLVFTGIYTSLKPTIVIYIIIAFTLRLMGYFFYYHCQSDIRIHNDNNRFAKLNISISLFDLATTVILTYFFSLSGYLVAVAVTPWFSILLHRQISSPFKKTQELVKGFWNYSLHSSLAYFLSESVFALDILFIGKLLNQESAALYRVAVIIPFNLAILPSIVLQTDLNKLTLNKQNRAFLTNYVWNYYRLFVPIGLLLVLTGFFLKDNILPWIFGKQYTGGAIIFFIALITQVINIWLRNLFGNLNACIGKAEWNTYAAFFSIVVLSSSLFILIPRFGITGAAIGMCIMCVTSGLLLAIFFKRYLVSLPNLKTNLQ